MLDVGVLYAEHWETIYRFLRRRMPGASGADVEDVTAMVFERVCRSAGAYQACGAPTEAWLYKIARNALIDDWRAQAARPTACEIVSDAPGGQATADAGADRQLEALDIAQTLMRLPPRFRLVIVERFLLGASHAETARVLGVSEESSRHLQQRALLKLRRMLAA